MKFSIITVNYNNKDGLRKTIQSVINQDFSDFEFIVIDGGSTDGSVNVIKEYQQQISFWVSEKDNGVYNGMNKGIKHTKGEYINFMNSGDTFYTKHTLSEVNQLLDGSDIIVGSDFNEDPVTKATSITILPIRISMATFFVQTFPHQSSFIKKTLFNDMQYDENLKIVADWKFFLKKVVYDGSSVQLLDLIICRREQGGISNNQVSKVQEERKIVLDQLMPLGIRKDYNTLSKLDYNTMYKLLNLCDNNKAIKILTIIIKILNKLFL